MSIVGKHDNATHLNWKYVEWTEMKRNEQTNFYNLFFGDFWCETVTRKRTSIEIYFRIVKLLIFIKCKFRVRYDTLDMLHSLSFGRKIEMNFDWLLWNAVNEWQLHWQHKTNSGMCRTTHRATLLSMASSVCSSFFNLIQFELKIIWMPWDKTWKRFPFFISPKKKYSAYADTNIIISRLSFNKSVPDLLNAKLTYRNAPSWFVTEWNLAFFHHHFNEKQ